MAGSKTCLTYQGTLDETVDQIITFFPDFNKKQLSDCENSLSTNKYIVF